MGDDATMLNDEAARQSLINVLKERPDLLLKLNRAVGDVLEEAGVEQGELTLEQVLDLVAESLDES